MENYPVKHVIKYSNGDIIGPCENIRRSLREPRRYVRSGALLDENLIKNACFEALLDRWIKPCMDDKGDWDRDQFLFRDGADPAAQDAFLARLIDKVTQKVWSDCPDEEIIKQVDAVLPAASAIMRFRIKTICVFLALIPEEVFLHKGNWYMEFLPNRTEELLTVRDGDSFELCFDGVEKLIPKLLYNSGDSLCAIKIVYGKAKYVVKLPPQSGLRALFSNGGTRLVSVKGSVSVNPAAERNAFIQLVRQKKPELYVWHSYYSKPFPVDSKGYFYDAAADGKGGAILLKDNGIYYTANKRLKTEQILPIRVYGAGPYWAIQYSDGRVETNLIKNGTRLARAWAMVENGNRSLLFLDAEGAWECRGTVTESLSKEDFAARMFSQFSNLDYCEEVEAKPIRIRVCLDGHLEVR